MGVDHLMPGGGFKGPKGSKKPLTAKMQQAAMLAATGLGRDKIAKELGIDPSTVSRWLAREDVSAIRAAELTKFVATIIPKAYAVLQSQLDSNNPWVAQGAARELIRLYNLQQGQADNSVVVTFGSMPRPGAPGTAGGVTLPQGGIETDFTD